MGPRLFSIGLILCSLAPLQAQNQPDPVAAVAMAVHEQDPKALELILRHGLMDPNPQVRQIAARVTNVRRVTSLLDNLRVGLDRETDPSVAREEVRAMIMLGSTRDIDRALYISDRFKGHLDDVIAAAAAHLGQPAIDIYFSSLSKREISKGDLLRIALWGRPQLAPAVSQRLIAANDDDAYTELLFTIDNDPAELLDAKTLLAGLSSGNADIRGETVWFLVNRLARANPPALDPAVKTAIAAMELPTKDLDTYTGLELLRRVTGLSKQKTLDFRVALHSSRLAQYRILFAPRRLLDFLIPEEKVLVFNGIKLPDYKSSTPSPFVLPSLMPNGVAAAVMKATSCNDQWIGNAKVTIDPSGRIAATDLSGVTTSDGCRRALDTLFKLSIAENTYISAPLESSSVFVAHPANAAVCFDEGAANAHGKALFGSPFVEYPQLLEGDDPEFPPGSKQVPTEVELEVVVTPEGCVRSARVVNGSTDPAINRTAVMTVSRWKFEPAASGTERVEVMFRMRVKFEPRKGSAAK
jgi:TonB family protein